jgi:hypothetical protein
VRLLTRPPHDVASGISFLNPSPNDLELKGREHTSSEIARTLNAKELTRRNEKPWTHRQVAAVGGRATLYRHGVPGYGGTDGRNRRLALLNSGSPKETR